MDKNLRFSKKTGKPFFITQELSLKECIKYTKKLRRVTLNVQRKGVERLFSKFGLLKYPISYMASTMFFQRMFFNNNLLRKLSDRIRFGK